MSLPWIDRALYAQLVESEGTRISDVARRGPLDAPVAHLGSWQLTDVVAHLGGVHRWAAEILETGAIAGRHRPGEERGDALIEWFDEGVQHLAAVLAEADLDAPCPNFSSGSPKIKAFWARRQAHETTMHRWDVESAAAQTSLIEPMLASDGIDELLHTFTRVRGSQVLTAPVGLACEDTGAEWVVLPAQEEGRVDVRRSPSADVVDPVARVSGTAENLLLAMWHRRTISAAALGIAGDRAVAEAFIAGPVCP
jgi:uncharacterized protein (TIGR03083 family)